MSLIKVLLLGACVVASLAHVFDDEDDNSYDLFHPLSEDNVFRHSIQRRSAFDDDVRSGRVRRSGHGVVGHVHTYVKTDHDGHFKWGVKHSVGKKYAGHHHHH